MTENVYMARIQNSEGNIEQYRTGALTIKEALEHIEFVIGFWTIKYEVISISLETART